MKICLFEREPDECFDRDNYYTEEMARDDLFWAGGNSNFITINSILDDLIHDIRLFLSDANYMTQRNVISCFNGLFSQHISSATAEADTLFKCIDKYNNYTEREDEYEIVCEVLSIIYNETFVTGYIKGCSQGDWMRYICPKTLVDNGSILFIESVLFGTGTEFTDSAGNIYYTSKVTSDEIKEELADFIMCAKSDIVLYKIKASHVSYTYDYKIFE